MKKLILAAALAATASIAQAANNEDKAAFCSWIAGFASAKLDQSFHGAYFSKGNTCAIGKQKTFSFERGLAKTDLNKEDRIYLYKNFEKYYLEPEHSALTQATEEALDQLNLEMNDWRIVASIFIHLLHTEESEPYFDGNNQLSIESVYKGTEFSAPIVDRYKVEAEH